MTKPYTVQFEEDPTQEVSKAIFQGLVTFNNQFVQDDQYHRLVITMRDGEQKIVGGLNGGTFWGWLHVDILWISEPGRGQGYGTRLLAMAVSEAHRRGCHGVHLDTLSFQALPFYEKKGYSVFGLLEDHPIGHTRYFLKKKL